MTDDLRWIVLRTKPTHRVEFEVLHQLTQRGYAGLLPFETVHEKRPGKKRAIERKYALFPCYVFAGLPNVAQDYERLRAAIPEIHGIVSRSLDTWSPHILRPADLVFIESLVWRESVKMTETDLHKALKPGKAVEVAIGGATQTTKIDAVTRKGVKVMLQMFRAMHVVEVRFASVRAA